MSRRRYLSTGISTDTRVNRLAMKSDFAALLYTWMIPHCGDDGSIPADADELLLIVMPGRRDKTCADIEAALRLIEGEGLIEWDEDEKSVNYPVAAFYKYQTYITEGRRKTTQNDEKPRSFQNGGDNSADQRNSAQNASSLKSSLNVKLKSSLTPPAPSLEGVPPQTKPKRQSKKSPVPIPDDFEPTPEMIDNACGKYGLTPEQVASKTDRFRNWALAKDQTYANWDRGWLNFMEPKAWDGQALNGGSINGHVPRRTGGAAAGGMTPQEFDAHIADLERQGL